MVLEARRCSRWNVESSSGRYVPSPRLLPLAQECIITDLYNQGVQRNTIDGFLVALASRSPVIQVASSLDYRREQRGLVLDPKDDMEAGDYGEVEAWHRWGTASKGWFVKGEEAEFEDAVRRLVGTEPGRPRPCAYMGGIWSSHGRSEESPGSPTLTCARMLWDPPTTSLLDPHS